MTSLKLILLCSALVVMVGAIPLWAKSTKDYETTGFQYLNQENFGEAVPQFLAAIEMDPKDWKAYQYLGDAYRGLGRMKEAFDAYDASLRLNPGNQNLRQFVAELRVKETSVLPREKTNFDDQRIEFQIYGNFSKLASESDASIWQQGWGIGLWAGYIAGPRLTVGVRMDYVVFVPNNKALADAYLPGYVYAQFSGTAATSFIQVIPSVKLNFVTDPQKPIRPYVMFGYGVMNASRQQIEITGLDYSNTLIGAIVPGYSETVPAISVAVGLPIQLPNDFSIPIELELSTGFTSGEPTSLYSGTIGLERAW